MVWTWGVLFLCSLLSLTLGDAGQKGAILRIKKKHVEEEIAKCIIGSNMGDQLTDLVRELNPEPPPDAEISFGLPPSPRLSVSIPHPPAVEITPRLNDSFNIRLKVMFGVYFEYSFDPLSKEVEIQVTKNFSAVSVRDKGGFRIQRCSSPCNGQLEINTAYKSSETVLEGATDMVQTRLRNTLIPVLEDKACDLLASILSRPNGCLLNKELLDFSPPGIQYNIKGMHMEDSAVILELRTAAGEGEEEGKEEGSMENILDSLPKIPDKAVADIIMTKEQLNLNFAKLLHPINPIILDKDHKMGFCMLEAVQKTLPGSVTDEELENYVMNLTAHEPPFLQLRLATLYVIHKLQAEVFHYKDLGKSLWTLVDDYYLPCDLSVTDHKLKISLSYRSGFVEVFQKEDVVINILNFLETLLDLESPLDLLESLHQEFPLPLVEGIRDLADLNIKCHAVTLQVSITPK